MQMSLTKISSYALLCLSLFCGGILTANAYYLNPTIYDNSSDIITGSFGGDTYGVAECYISYESDGTVANGGCGSDTGSSFVRVCEVIGDCLAGSTDVAPNDGWIFSTLNENFHIIVATSTIGGTEAQDWYNSCINLNYSDCLNVAGLTTDHLIQFNNTNSTSTGTTTIEVDTRPITYGFFALLWVGTFLLTVFGISKFT